MKITVITLFPEMIGGFFEQSILKRAQDKKLADIEIINLRKYATDKYKSVDGRPYGGGAGMILKIDVLHNALKSISRNSKSQSNLKSKTILTSAKGKVFNQQKAKEYSKINQLVIIAGHYEGVDERILDEVDEEISMGDFVMTGGEIAACAIVDSVVRLIPGVLKKEEASEIESFYQVPINHLIEIVGNHEILIHLKKKGVKKVRLIEYPHYTRPEEFQDKKVPDILLSGNHKAIEDWRLRMAFETTLKKRPDLLLKVGAEFNDH